MCGTPDWCAERLIGAERGTEKIAVEIKGLDNPSFVAELEHIVGQFSIYRSLLERLQPERTLYLALPQSAYGAICKEDLGTIVLHDYMNHVLVFSEEAEEVVEWVIIKTELP